MSNEEQVSSGESHSANEVSKTPVDINDYTPSQADTFREQAKRIKERKERSAGLIDDVWDNAKGDAKALKEQGREPEFDEPKTVELESDVGANQRAENNENAEESERTFEDVTSDIWDSQGGEPEAEADDEGDAEDAEVVDESAEGEESQEGLQESGEDGEVASEDIILATIEGEDGPEQIEIPKNAKITVKVDGEEQEISLQEFANGISGQKAISQKFSALNGEQKAFEDRLQNWNESSAKAAELIKGDKAVEAIQHVAEMMGQDPHLLFTTLFEEITPVLNDYANLSEQERGVWVQDLKNKKAEFQAKSAQAELSKLKAEQDQQTKVQNVQEAYGLDEATFTHAYHALEAEMEAGTLSKAPITPELVGEYSKLVTYEGYAVDALKGTEHEGDSTAINQILQAANQMERNGQEVSAQVIEAMVSEALGRQQQIEKSKSVQKSLKKKGVKPKAKGNKKPKQVQRKDQSDQPKHWMQRAQDELDKGVSAADLGLLSNKNKRK